MATYVPPKINTQYIFYISLVSQANTKVFQANPTLAAADFNVATDDGAPGALGTTPVVDADFTKRVKVTLAAGEMNGGNVTLICSDAAGAEWCDLTINIQTSARQVDDLAFPVTSGRGLDVTATGAAGVDWANVENPTTALALTGTTIATTQKVDVETIKTNPVVNAGTVTFPTTATLASTTNITGGTFTTVTNLTNAPTNGDLTATMKTSVTTAVPTAAVNAAAVWDLDATAHQTLGTFGQAIGDPVADANTIYGAVVTGASGATVAADIIAVKSDTAAILLDTAEIGAAGVGLTAVALADATSDAVIADAVWNAATVTYGGAGSYGLLVETDLDAAISTRLATAGYTAPTNLTAAQIATGVWQDATAGDFTAALSIGKSVMNGVALGTGLTVARVTLADTLTTYTGNTLQTADHTANIAAILVDTGTTLDTAVTAIKTATDKLTFTVANQVDANLRDVNSVLIGGAGTAGNPFGPA